MKNISKVSTFFISIIGTLTLSISAHGGSLISTGPQPYVVPRTQVHAYYSDIVQQEYELRVKLPDGYETEPDKRYPVIYALDGQWYFTLIGDIAGSVAYDNQISDAIVVAITWGGEGADPAVLRVRDFTPTPVPRLPGSGGAADFLAALEAEIIPFIEGRYRANRRRVIAGSSYGGLFVTYSLIRKPRLFDGYLALGASVNWDEGYIFDRLEELGWHHFPRGIPFYFGFGERDPGIAQFHEFTEAFDGRRFHHIDFQPSLIEEAAHSSVNPIGFTYGLMHTLERPRIRLWWRQLQRYTGAYDFQMPGFPQLTVEATRGGLVLNIPGQPSFTVFPDTRTLFFADGAPIEALFDWKNGRVQSVEITADRTTFTAVKAK